MSAEATRYCPRCLSTFHDAPPRCPNLACNAEAPASGWGVLLGPGDAFDRHYRVLRQLAVGGGGITYLGREIDADDRETGPLLAIKVLYAGREQGSTLQRLSTEAQILRELNHPHIIECLGFVARAGHTPYLVTRFASGGSLLDHVGRVGPLPPLVVAAVGRQICQALALAHARGIVHRDLKPENLLLEAAVPAGLTPHVRVADFGIAKVQSTLGPRTRVGAFVGTPAYASPEQLLGGAPSPAADIYSLGAVLYFCATGTTVWQPEDEEDLEERHDRLVARLPARLRPTPGQDPRQVARLERVLDMAMAVDPAKRADLAALEAALSGEPEPARPGGLSAARAAEETIKLDLDLVKAAARAALGAPAPEPAPREGAHQAWRPPEHASRSGGQPSASGGGAPTAGAPGRRDAGQGNVAVVLLLVALGGVGFLAALGLGWWLWWG